MKKFDSFTFYATEDELRFINRLIKRNGEIAEKLKHVDGVFPFKHDCIKGYVHGLQLRKKWNKISKEKIYAYLRRKGYANKNIGEQKYRIPVKPSKVFHLPRVQTEKECLSIA